MSYPTNLPTADLFTLLAAAKGQERDLDKILAAAYNLLGYAIFVARGQADKGQVMQEVAAAANAAAIRP